MLAEQLRREYPCLLDAFSGAEALEDEALWPLSEALHNALLSVVPRERGSERAYHLARIGESFHGRRRLAEAGRFYAQVLEYEPPARPDAAQRDAMRRHAPVLLTTDAEFFPLVDVVALHHPALPLIAYHLFWEDDYNFPDDYEPCDHEEVWVAYEPGTGRARDVRTFFHSHILSSAAAVEEANGFDGRPRIRSEWGLHGSLPTGWESLTLPDGTAVSDYLERNYRDVRTGGRASAHPLKRRWPKRFEGELSDYTAFPRQILTEDLLLRKDALWKCSFSNPTLQQYCIPYNFSVKFDWPFDMVAWGMAGTA